MRNSNLSKSKREPLAAKVTPLIKKAVELVAEEEERSISNVIERALKNAPQVKAKIEQIESRQAVS